MRVAELDTPALVVDLEIMERNLRRAADYTVAHGLRFRPHTKTRKIPSLAIRQLKLGAVGLTVAKVSEAEVMLGAWPGDRCSSTDRIPQAAEACRNCPRGARDRGSR
jgi:D-serine deaminase-like pyridoxal phosphate-dependent protein